jgi:hypothetical protein
VVYRAVLRGHTRDNKLKVKLFRTAR